MRRTDKEVTDRDTMVGILAEAGICRLAMVDNGQPYLVPMNFVYRDGCLYFHSAPEGRKLEVLKRYPRVCFEVEARVEIASAEKACDWSTRYFSVVGYGEASLVEDAQDKLDILQAIMQKYSGRGNWEIAAGVVNTLVVLRVSIEQMTAKKSKYDSWVPGAHGTEQEGGQPT